MLTSIIVFLMSEENRSDPANTRQSVLASIEGAVEGVVPDKYRDPYREGEEESKDIVDDVEEWLRAMIESVDQQIEIDNSETVSEPYRRHIFTLDAERPYVVCVHDPMQTPLPSAENITGVDYMVEFPIDDERDKMLFVQTKRSDSKHGVPPKQYFGLGAVYMYSQYLAGVGQWTDRYQNGVRYTRRDSNSHPEFLYIKIIPEQIYIPLNGILSTYQTNSGHTQVEYTHEPAAPIYPHRLPNVRYDLDQVLSEKTEILVDMSETKASSFHGLEEFSEAMLDCEIGLRHDARTNWTARKANTLAYYSEMADRATVGLFEVRRNRFDETLEYLRNPR